MLEALSHCFPPPMDQPMAIPGAPAPKKRLVRMWLRVLVWLGLGFAVSVITVAIPLHQRILGDYCAQDDFGFPLTVYHREYQYNSTPRGADVKSGARIGNTNTFIEDVGSIIAECGMAGSVPPSVLAYLGNILIFSAVFFAVDVLARRTWRIAYLLSLLFVLVCWVLA